MREISLNGRGNRRVRGAHAIAALLLACSAEQAPPERFDARRVGPGDSDRRLLGFDASRTKLYMSREVASFSAWDEGRSPTLDDVFALDVESGRVELVAEKVNWFTEPTPDDPEGPTLFVRQEVAESGAPATLTLTRPNGARLDFDHVVPATIGWSNRTIAFVRETASARELWAGPFDSPRLVSGDSFVHDWQFIGGDELAFAAEPPGALPGNPGIFRVGIAEGEAMLEFPAQISSADWAGAAPAPSLVSIGLLDASVVEGTLVAELGGGCWSATEPSATGAADQRCYLLYTRLMADGTARAFVGLPREHREIALPGIGGRFAFSTVGPDTHFIPFSGNAPFAGWLSAQPDSEGRVVLNVWDDANARHVSCEVTFGAERFLSWRGDGRLLVYGDGEALTFADSDGCRQVAAANTGGALFSPQGSRMIWRHDGDLWTAAGDASEARRAVSDVSLQVRGFVDEERLLALRTSNDGPGLILLDLTEDVIREHALAEQVFFTGPRLGSRLLACGNAYSTQDRTGTLSLIDLELEAREDIADSISDYAVGWPPALGQDSFPFAYVKLGRFASERDGLWIGRIPRDYAVPR